MEVEVLAVDGVPEGSVISVRAGTQRKQASAGAIGSGSSPFRIALGEKGINPFRIDLLRPAGTTRMCLRPGLEATYAAEIQGAGDDGRSALVRFCVREAGKRGPPPPAIAAKKADNEKALQVGYPPKLVDEQDRLFQAAVEAANDYMETHQILQFVRALMQTVVLKKPKNPFDFIAQQFHAAAGLASADRQPRVATPVGAAVCRLELRRRAAGMLRRAFDSGALDRVLSQMEAGPARGPGDAADALPKAEQQHQLDLRGRAPEQQTAREPIAPEVAARQPEEEGNSGSEAPDHSKRALAAATATPLAETLERCPAACARRISREVDQLGSCLASLENGLARFSHEPSLKAQLHQTLCAHRSLAEAAAELASLQTDAAPAPAGEPKRPLVQFRSDASEVDEADAEEDPVFKVRLPPQASNELGNLSEEEVRQAKLKAQEALSAMGQLVGGEDNDDSGEEEDADDDSESAEEARATTRDALSEVLESERQPVGQEVEEAPRSEGLKHVLRVYKPKDSEETSSKVSTYVSVLGQGAEEEASEGQSQVLDEGSARASGRKGDAAPQRASQAEVRFVIGHLIRRSSATRGGHGAQADEKEAPAVAERAPDGDTGSTEADDVRSVACKPGGFAAAERPLQSEGDSSGGQRDAHRVEVLAALERALNGAQESEAVPLEVFAAALEKALQVTDGASLEACNGDVPATLERTSEEAERPWGATSGAAKQALTRIGLRERPDVNSAPTGDVLAEGEIFTVLEAFTPKSPENQTFYKVAGKNGWVFEYGVRGSWAGRRILEAAPSDKGVAVPDRSVSDDVSAMVPLPAKSSRPAATPSGAAVAEAQTLRKAKALTRIGLREWPDVNAALSGDVLEEGEIFAVSEVVIPDAGRGQTFYKVSGKVGWVFEFGIRGSWAGKRIVEALAVPAHAAGVLPTLDPASAPSPRPAAADVEATAAEREILREAKARARLALESLTAPDWQELEAVGARETREVGSEPKEEESASDDEEPEGEDDDLDGLIDLKRAARMSLAVATGASPDDLQIRRALPDDLKEEEKEEDDYQADNMRSENLRRIARNSVAVFAVSAGVIDEKESQELSDLKEEELMDAKLKAQHALSTLSDLPRNVEDADLSEEEILEAKFKALNALARVLGDGEEHPADSGEDVRPNSGQRAAFMTAERFRGQNAER